MIFCYFTFKNDFDLLIVSIRNLRKLFSQNVIYIVVDYKKDFSLDQEKDLLNQNCKIIKSPISFGGNLKSDKFIEYQMKLFKLIFAWERCKHICKIDSDVIVRNNIFNELRDFNGFQSHDAVTGSSLFLGAIYVVSVEYVRRVLNLIKTDKGISQFLLMGENREDFTHSFLRNYLNMSTIDFCDKFSIGAYKRDSDQSDVIVFLKLRQYLAYRQDFVKKYEIT